MTTGQQTSSSAIKASLPSLSSTPTYHARLLQAASSGLDADHVRSQIRQAVCEAVSAAFAVHVGGNADGEFLVDSQQVEGQIPDDVTTHAISSLAKLTAARQSTQVKLVAQQLRLICSLVSLPGATPEVILVGIRAGTAGLHASTRTVEFAANFEKLWARGHLAAANQWKLNSLAAIIELVSDIEGQHTLAAASNLAANQLARFLSCERVAIGWFARGQMTVQTVSGLNQFDANSEAVMAMREAMNECQLHGAVCLWPPEDGQRSAMLAHAALAKRHNYKSLLSSPLKTADGRTLGSLLFADNGALLHGERFRNFVRAASPRIANALDVVERCERGAFARLRQAVLAFMHARRGRVSLLLSCLLAGLLVLPMPYRIRCRCLVEPVERRYAVAPFQGMVEEGYVEPGAIVSPGTLLARMDGRELKWELSAAEAKLGQAQKQREVDLTDRNVPNVLISQLESEKLQAQINLLRHRIEHLEMRSPIAGVVLSGLLEKGQTAPVDKGDVLYEIGPLEELKLEIEVPAVDVAQFRAGQCVKVWLDGFETDPLSGRLEHLEPLSELRNDQNVFVAKLKIPNPEQRFRPGMRGSARISGPRRPLAWNLFHKPWEYIVSRMTWW